MGQIFSQEIEIKPLPPPIPSRDSVGYKNLVEKLEKLKISKDLEEYILVENVICADTE